MTHLPLPHPCSSTALLDAFVRLPATAVHARRAEARRLLSSPDIYQALLQAAGTDALNATAFDIARFAVEDRIGDVWTHGAEAWLELFQATWQESARFCTAVAWTARQTGNSALLHLTADRVLHTPAQPITARTRLHLHAVTLRYDFRCRALQDLFNRHPHPVAELDPFSRSLYAFALLGQSNPAGLDLIGPLLDASSDDLKVAHALLHGLWLGEDLPHQPARILNLLNSPAFASQPDAIALFRKAGALRRLRRFDEALSAVDDAREHLPLDTDASVHADLTRERDLISTARAHSTRLRSPATTDEPANEGGRLANAFA